jgi:PAS domain S-box-containing protein
MTDDRARRQRDLIPALGDFLWEAGTDGAIDLLSPEFEAATGVAPASLLGWKLAALAGDGASAPILVCIEETRPFRDLILKLQSATGAVVWVELSGSPDLDAEPGPTYWGVGRVVTAKIEAERALRRSELRYRELFEAASDWFWETDTANRIVFIFISPDVEAKLGLVPETHYGRRIAEIEGVTITAEQGRASLAALKAERPFENFVYSRKLENGKTIWLSSNGAPYYDEAGRFRGYRGITREITEQVEAEQALRASEQRFRQMFELASDFYWEMDRKYRYAGVSAGWDAVHGLSFEDVKGKRLMELPGVMMEPDDGKRVLLAQQAKESFRDVVYSRKLASGETRWISVCGMPSFGKDGEFLGYQGVGVDVTARVEAELAASLAQQRLHDAVNYVREPLVVFDGDDRALAFNSAFIELHRRADGRLAVYQGAPFAEMAQWQIEAGFYAELPEETAPDLDTLLMRYRSNGEHIYWLGDERWMHVTYRPLPGGGKVGLWSDITAVKRAEADRRDLERQLHHSQRLEALGTLAGGVAHEINNALVPAVTLAKLMARKQPEGSSERRSLQLIHTGAERSRELVQQILAFSRKEDVNRASQIVDVGAVLRDALAFTRATMPASIRVVDELAPVPMVDGDANQLHQVIVNLITNAAHAIGQSPGQISVTLLPDPDGSNLRLAVADTGCGMDQGTIARIFEPFFTTKPVGEGTGLGLSVVHGIVKAHGGQIQVTSQPGQGSRFEIILPAATAARTSEAA